MSDIIQTSTYKQTGAVPLVYTTLGASTTFQLYPDMPQTLVIFNDTAAPITPILVGDDASVEFAISGVGYRDLSGGYQGDAIPAGQAAAVPLQSIRYWLKGVATVNGCAGAKAAIVTESQLPQYEPFFIQGGRLVAAGRLTVNSKVWG